VTTNRRDDPNRYKDKPLMDRLGVKPEDVVAVVGVDDPDFARSLAERLGRPPRARLARKCNAIFYAADSPRALMRLRALRSYIVPNGAIWVVSRKGREATLKDVEVIAAAKSADLVDTKVVSFSPTHTSLKLVIPRKSR
jgi:hypothetical protein